MPNIWHLQNKEKIYIKLFSTFSSEKSTIKPEPEKKRPFWKSYNFLFTHSFEFWFLANGSSINRKKKKLHIISWNCVIRTKINKRWKRLKKIWFYLTNFDLTFKQKVKLLKTSCNKAMKVIFNYWYSICNLKKPETSPLNRSTDPQFENKAIAEIKA